MSDELTDYDPKQPVAVGTWRQIERNGRTWLASLQAEALPVYAPGPRDVKWVAVIYTDPNRGAHYVRGESLHSMDEAIELAFSLMQPLLEAGQPDPGVLVKMELPDGVAAMVRFDGGVSPANPDVVTHTYTPPDPEQQEEIRLLVREFEGDFAEEVPLHFETTEGKVLPAAGEAEDGES
jgi:hypothetical protein